MNLVRRWASTALILVVASAVDPLVPSSDALAAQSDVELLGRIHGTRPPASYYELRARDPDAFEFSRALRNRNPGLGRLDPGPMRMQRIGPRDGAVEGVFRFPLVLGYFAGESAPPPFDVAQVQREFFDGPNSRAGTIPEYYAEVSRGRVELRGVSYDWRQASLTRSDVTGGVSGLGGGRVGDFIHSVLTEVDDGSIDWGQFDNDGPDGVPNSGDDDGFVDVLTVFHSTAGAECGGSDQANRIWSHRWSLRWAAPAKGAFFTSTPRTGGGQIRIDDYTIQPIYDCAGTEINEIGVFAHELGHGFGLPDLYCTASQCTSSGIGRWGLMGSGSWGCGGFDPARPCHMSAWSKAMLGWVDVVRPEEGLDHGVLSLPPVVASGQVMRVDALDGSGEYYLLENRQRIGFDGAIPREGLLVWHVDPAWVTARWPANAVNATPSRNGVGLVQADGRRDLEFGRGSGDTGDPFPGSANAVAFHAGSAPASRTHAGAPSAVTLLDIAADGDAMRFRLLNRMQSVRVSTQGTDNPSLVKVDDEALPPGGVEFLSAPFQSHVLSAEAGESLGEGVRRAFERWSDDAGAARVRTVTTGVIDTTYTAVYGQEQVRVTASVTRTVLDVAPGRVTSSPYSSDLWFPAGSDVALTATPSSGFVFLGWQGVHAGKGNPLNLRVDAPLAVEASFGLGFGALAQPLLGGAPLEPEVAVALDRFGNSNGGYDVGDLRALLRRGDLEVGEALAAALRATAARTSGAGGGR